VAKPGQAYESKVPVKAIGDNANLSGATFGDHANLLSSHFGHNANLSGTTFAENATLLAHFGDNASATFGDGSLIAGTFSADVDLRAISSVIGPDEQLKELVSHGNLDPWLRNLAT
jgi:hypothetical protein